MHQASPTLWLKLTKQPQKNGHRIREPEIFGDKSSHQKEVQLLHHEADAGFEGDGLPRELTAQLAKEEQERRSPTPPENNGGRGPSGCTTGPSGD